MDALLEPIIRSPMFPEYFEELQAAYLKECEKRRRFYEEITEDHKAEFINGEVITQSPAQVRHINASDNLLALLKIYVQKHQLGRVFHEKALVCFPRNDYEPDIVFFGSAKAAGLIPSQLRLPIPDFIVEILSPSTEKMDRGGKREDYARHGVREYWLVDPGLETVERCILSVDHYEPSPPQREGVVASQVIPGFQVPIRAIFDSSENLRVIATILT
ncbi:MAG: Uma2 family endonuclease [Verrucomicrobia bacterium]|nr:Uma2 family endonuclease [Verrucomicrobiota bacterium]